MNPMRITKIGHSCLLLEDGTTRILTDPGKYSFLNGEARMPENLEGLNAILVTHEHGDHADPEAIKTILGKNKVPVKSNAGVKTALQKSGIEVELFESGTEKIGSIEVEAIPAAHEKLFFGEPQNTAYHFNKTLLLTGDSLDPKLYGIKTQVLGLPIMAPWMNIHQGAEFAKNMQPEVVIPVHDGFAVPDFVRGQHQLWTKLLEDLGIRFIAPELGKTMQF